MKKKEEQDDLDIEKAIEKFPGNKLHFCITAFSCSVCSVDETTEIAALAYELRLLSSRLRAMLGEPPHSSPRPLLHSDAEALDTAIKDVETTLPIPTPARKLAAAVRELMPSVGEQQIFRRLETLGWTRHRVAAGIMWWPPRRSPPA